MSVIRFLLLPVVVAVSALLAMPAHALTYGGSTATAPTFNSSSVPGADSRATAVRYEAYSFVVRVTGAYEMLSIAFPTWDNVLVLYQGRFIPDQPEVNFISHNDDYLGIGLSRIDANLTANTSYVLVTTGYLNSAFGTYANSITGAATVSPLPNANPLPVPEPASALLMACGVVGLLWARRRSAEV